MSKFDEQIDIYLAEFKDNLKMSVDEDLLRSITKGLGPSIYGLDASRVSCSDPVEMARVKTNFAIKKLGLADDAATDAALKEVCTEMGSSNRNKFRAMFYYLLVKKFNKEGNF